MIAYGNIEYCCIYWIENLGGSDSILPAKLGARGHGSFEYAICLNRSTELKDQEQVIEQKSLLYFIECSGLKTLRYYLQFLIF